MLAVKEIGAVDALLGTPLRAAEVQVHSIAVGLDESCGAKKRRSVIARELERVVVVAWEWSRCVNTQGVHIYEECSRSLA